MLAHLRCNRGSCWEVKTLRTKHFTTKVRRCVASIKHFRRQGDFVTGRSIHVLPHAFEKSRSALTPQQSYERDQFKPGRAFWAKKEGTSLKNKRTEVRKLSNMMGKYGLDRPICCAYFIQGSAHPCQLPPFKKGNLNTNLCGEIRVLNVETALS